MKRFVASNQKIEWLFDSNSTPSQTTSGDLKTFPFVYMPGVAKGYTEHLALSNGTFLFKNYHEFISEDRPLQINLGDFKSDFPGPVFNVHMMHSGQVDVLNNVTKRTAKRVIGLDLFSRFNSIDINQNLYTDENIYLTGLFIPENQLINFFGSDVAENFFQILGLHKNQDYCEINLPQSLSAKVANCIPSSLNGNMRSLFATSAIIQYLLEANLYISNSNNFALNLGKMDFDVTALYAELLCVTENAPTIEELSKKYNVSASKLNQSFIKKYDQSIYSFLTNQRLDQAHEALVRTEIPMKTLAHKIGYSHVNHFITAFKKKFGVTPGSLRKIAE